MGKQEFLARLREGLSGLPREDVEERLAFYSEMIDDRMEEGMSEAEAVAAAGSVEEIVAQAVADVPFAKIARERIKRSTRMRPVTVLLLVLGSPIWLSLAIALAAVVFSGDYFPVGGICVPGGQCRWRHAGWRRGGHGRRYPAGNCPGGCGPYLRRLVDSCLLWVQSGNQGHCASYKKSYSLG